ncbi:MAG: putative metallopeptidase [Candidatus Pacearchaeota archaeon]
MKYYPAFDIELKAKQIIKILEMKNIKEDRIAFFKSKGSNARGVIARCHGLSKIQQLGLKTEPFYIIEMISEKFDKLSEEEKIKTIIHELMHIPNNFGGGFRHHNFVNKKSVESLYKRFIALKEKEKI